MATTSVRSRARKSVQLIYEVFLYDTIKKRNGRTIHRSMNAAFASPLADGFNSVAQDGRMAIVRVVRRKAVA